MDVVILVSSLTLSSCWLSPISQFLSLPLQVVSLTVSVYLYLLLTFVYNLNPSPFLHKRIYNYLFLSPVTLFYSSIPLPILLFTSYWRVMTFSGLVSLYFCLSVSSLSLNLSSLTLSLEINFYTVNFSPPKHCLVFFLNFS